MASQQGLAQFSVSKEINQTSSFKVVVQNIRSLSGTIRIPLPADDIQGEKLVLQIYYICSESDIYCQIRDEEKLKQRVPLSPAADYTLTVHHNDDGPTHLPFSKAFTLNAASYITLMSNQELQSTYCTPDGSVTIYVTPINSHFSATAKQSILPQRISSLYLNPQHADITLIVDGERLPAHKCILCSSSPVFQAMFQHPMQEAITSEVQIADHHSAQTVKAMLHYLYTGTIPEEDCQREAVPLMMLAAFYQIQDLAQYLRQNIVLGVENIKQFLQAVPMYGSEDALFLERVMQFVADHAEETVRQPAFLDGLDAETLRIMLRSTVGVQGQRKG